MTDDDIILMALPGMPHRGQRLELAGHVLGSQPQQPIGLSEHYATKAQVRTLQRWVKAPRTELARQVVMRAVAVQAEDAAPTSS